MKRWRIRLHTHKHTKKEIIYIYYIYIYREREREWVRRSDRDHHSDAAPLAADKTHDSIAHSIKMH